jgi:glucose-1-phosphatase
MLRLEGIEAIVFDLGGVIIELDFQRSFDQFAALSGKSAEEIHHGLLSSGLLLKYEKGEYSDIQFFEVIKQVFEIDASDEELEAAFVALLLHIPKERIDLIRGLAKDYRLFLLSNTNAIHYRAVNKILHRDTGCEDLSHLFETIFLSYEMALAKPGKEIYEEVIRQAQLNPATTLFLDDNAGNLEGASAVGIQTALVSPEHSILRLFHHE